MATTDIIYEQPTNELIRVCLRLEQLFAQIDHLRQDLSLSNTHNLVSTVIQVLHLLDRPDLKAKLTKELTHLTNTLSRLTQTTGVDQEKLAILLDKLEALSCYFLNCSGKIGYRLREVELLNNLRLHLTTPGGGCCFDTPLYHYWLHQDIGARQKVVEHWLQELSTIHAAVILILKLLRDSTEATTVLAEQGYYQSQLDPQTNLRLLRVIISKELKIFPEISVGRHGLNITFFSPNVENRPTQSLHTVRFQLACCS